MATKIGDDPQRSERASVFERIRKRIHEDFDCIIQRVTERRQALLEQLSELEQNDSEEMKSSKQEMEQLFVTLKSEAAKKSLQKSIDDLTEKIIEYENKVSKISFTCETNELEWRISQLGVFSTAKKDEKIVNIVIEYDSIKKLLLSFGTHGTETKEFYHPRGVLVDEDHNRVFIPDHNNRIQVWSMQGQYLTKFGEGTLDFPWEIVLHDEILFVSDLSANLVSKWCYNSLNFIAHSNTTQGSRQGLLSQPAGIDIDSGEVFVLELGNKRVSVFDLDLRFKRIMADQVIDYAYCLRIRSDVIYIVEKTGVIKLFSKTDQLVRTINKCKIFSDSVFHFNFDSALNFLITDQSKNSLFILSPEGELMHSICFDTWGLEDPFGIGVTRNGNIMISFQKGSSAAIIC